MTRVTTRQTASKASKPKPPAPKKWHQYGKSPFPRYSRPLPSECRQAHETLATLHGDRDPLASNAMTADGVQRPASFPDVLDGLVYAVLGQATNENNAIRQVASMDARYGAYTNYEAIVAQGEEALAATLQCGGLHVRKAKMLMGILRQVERATATATATAAEDSKSTSKPKSPYSLNGLRALTDEAAMRELLSLPGIGPKTASCVLALTLGRQRFVVDTHIHRITGILGWRPARASPEQARGHLECRIPAEHKYALHLLLITHGRECPRCRTGGDKSYECPLLAQVGQS